MKLDTDIGKMVLCTIKKISKIGVQTDTVLYQTYVKNVGEDNIVLYAENNTMVFPNYKYEYNGDFYYNFCPFYDGSTIKNIVKIIDYEQIDNYLIITI